MHIKARKQSPKIQCGKERNLNFFVMIPWKIKVHKLIYLLCQQSYLQANRKKDGSFYKKHRPYSIPETAERLIDCLNKNDEELAKAIMLFDYEVRKALTN